MPLGIGWGCGGLLGGFDGTNNGSQAKACGDNQGHQGSRLVSSLQGAETHKPSWDEGQRGKGGASQANDLAHVCISLGPQALVPAWAASQGLKHHPMPQASPQGAFEVCS